MDALPWRRVKALGLLGLTCALLMTALAPSAQGAANGRKVQVGVPARGDVDMLTFDVRARGRRAPGRLAVRLQVPKRLRSRLGVAMIVDTERRVKRFTLFVVHRRQGGAGASQRSGRVTVTVRGIDRQVSVRNIERATDVLDGLTDKQATSLCTADLETVRTFFGLRGVGSDALARALLAVLCDTGDDDDVRFLEDLGIIVPEDSDEFECGPFPGNPFEATCVFSDTAIDAVRIAGTGGLIFSECFAGTNPCMVEQPGRPGNSVLFDVPDGSRSTGPLNVRSSDTLFDGWGYMQLMQSRDGGRTFEPVEGFIP